MRRAANLMTAREIVDAVMADRVSQATYNQAIDALAAILVSVRKRGIMIDDGVMARSRLLQGDETANQGGLTLPIFHFLQGGKPAKADS